VSRGRVWVSAASVVVASIVSMLAPSAIADPAVCGKSGTHTICITVPTTPLTDEATIQISDSPNGGEMLVVWQTGATADHLITRFQSSGTTGDYSFVWPTQKYLDATGTLKARIGRSTALPRWMVDPERRGVVSPR